MENGLNNPLHWLVRLLLLWVAWPAGAVPCPEPLQDFEQAYVLYRNDKPVGEVRLTLKRQGNDWLLDSVTRANRGVVSLLGAEVREWVRFRCGPRGYQPLESLYQRKVLFRKQKTHLIYDWKQGRVTGTHKGKAVDMPVVDGLVDRLGIQLLLASDLRAGRTLHYRVQDRHHQRDWAFESGKPPHLPPDTFTNARAYRRVDDNPRRETWFWLEPFQSDLPVQIFHREKKTEYLSRLRIHEPE